MTSSLSCSASEPAHCPPQPEARGIRHRNSEREYLALSTVSTLAAPILNGSFQSELANLTRGDPITAWSASGNTDWACIAQNTGPYPCGDAMDSKFPSPAADGSRGYRVGANGDFPRDPANPNLETNSVYEATWNDIVALNYNYLSQTVATTAGNNYLLTFQLQGNVSTSALLWVLGCH